MNAQAVNTVNSISSITAGWPLGIIGAIIVFFYAGKWIAGLIKKLFVAIIIFIIIAVIVAQGNPSIPGIGVYYNFMHSINSTIFGPLNSKAGK